MTKMSETVKNETLKVEVSQDHIEESKVKIEEAKNKNRKEQEKLQAF